MVPAPTMSASGLSDVIMALGRDEFGDALMRSLRKLCRADMYSAFAFRNGIDMQYLLSSGGGMVTEDRARHVSRAYARQFWRSDPIFQILTKCDLPWSKPTLCNLDSHSIEDDEYRLLYDENGVV